MIFLKQFSDCLSNIIGVVVQLILNADFWYKQGGGSRQHRQ